MEHRLTLRWDKINGDYSKQDILNTKDRGIKSELPDVFTRMDERGNIKRHIEKSTFI